MTEKIEILKRRINSITEMMEMNRDARDTAMNGNLGQQRINLQKELDELVNNCEIDNKCKLINKSIDGANEAISCAKKQIACARKHIAESNDVIKRIRNGEDIKIIDAQNMGLEDILNMILDTDGMFK